MTAIVARLVAGAVVSALGRAIAGYVDSPVCPSAPASWLCLHWATVAMAGGFVAGALGCPVKRAPAAERAGQARQALSLAPLPEPAPDLEPTQLGRSDAEIAADEQRGQNGAG